MLELWPSIFGPFNDKVFPLRTISTICIGINEITIILNEITFKAAINRILSRKDMTFTWPWGYIGMLTISGTGKTRSIIVD